MFRNFVEPSVQFLVQSVFTIDQNQRLIYIALGKFLGALITFVGPELQMDTIYATNIKSNCLLTCYVLQTHNDPTVIAEAILSLQKLHLFCPKLITITNLIPQLLVSYYAFLFVYRIKTAAVYLAKND